MKSPQWYHHFLHLFGLSQFSVERQFLEDYRTLLLGQYKALNHANPSHDPAAQSDAEALVKLIAAKDAEFEWADLYRLELAIIKLEPEALLWSRSWILRQEYLEMAGEVERAAYKKFKVQEVEPAPKDVIGWSALRAELTRLQEELNWRYLALWTIESFRGALMTGVFVASMVMLVLFGGLIWLAGSWATHDFNGLLIGLIFSAGVLGGMASTLRRVQQANLAGNVDLDLAGMNNGNLGVYLSPGLGGLFALVLTGLFGSGLASGGAFPVLTGEMFCGCGCCDQLATREVAKLLVWSFISGFSERFVPDRLAKLAADAPQADIKAITKNKTGATG